jgi:hypothetical protein
MQSGVNLNEVVVVGYGNYKSSFTGTFKQVKAEVLSVKRYKYSQALAGEIAGFV